MLSQLFAALLSAGGVWLIVQLVSGHQHRRKVIQKFGCEPPVQVARPLFGVIEMFKYLKAFSSHKFLPYAQDMFDESGYTFRETALGESFVWTAEPANIRECLSLQFKNFELGAFRRQMAIPLFGKGIFTSDGKDWVHFRTAMRPSFKKANLGGDLDMFEDHIQNLIKRIPSDGSTVDIQELFQEFTMDTTTEFLFGFSSGALLGTDAETREYSAAFTTAMRRTVLRGAMGIFMDLRTDKKLVESCTIVHKYVDKLVERAIACKPSSSESGGRYIYLHEMSNSTNNPRELRDHAMAILLAGRDTTASLLSFTFMLLSQNPDCWKQLRSEVNEVFQGELPTADGLKRLKYVYYVFNETMRLYTPIPFNLRSATQDTTLPAGGGPLGKDPIIVWKGDTVCFAPITMHRRKDIWGDDAEEFRPMRWENPRPEMEAAFLPFNAGPRVCIGQGFALSEAAYTVSRLVQTFNTLESKDNRPWLEDVCINLSSLNGVHVGLSTR